MLHLWRLLVEAMRQQKAWQAHPRTLYTYSLVNGMWTPAKEAHVA